MPQEIVGGTQIALEPMDCSRAETPRRREELVLDADKPSVLKVEPVIGGNGGFELKPAFAGS